MSFSVFAAIKHPELPYRRNSMVGEFRTRAALVQELLTGAYDPNCGDMTLHDLAADYANGQLEQLAQNGFTPCAMHRFQFLSAVPFV